MQFMVEHVSERRLLAVLDVQPCLGLMPGRLLHIQGGLARIKANLASSVKKGRMKQEQADAVFGRITGTLTYDDFKRVDMVIEAAIEVCTMR